MDCEIKIKEVDFSKRDTVKVLWVGKKGEFVYESETLFSIDGLRSENVDPENFIWKTLYARFKNVFSDHQKFLALKAKEEKLKKLLSNLPGKTLKETTILAMELEK